MKPLLFNFKHYFINKLNNDNIFLKSKKPFITSSNHFKIKEIIENNVISSLIDEEVPLLMQEKDLLFERRFCEKIFKYLLKEKTLFDKSWRIVPFNQGLILNFNIINYSIIYTKFENKTHLTAETALYFTKKCIKKLLNIKMNNYPSIKTIFTTLLNYKDNLNLLNIEALQITLNNLSFNNKLQFLNVLLETKLLTIYMKCKKQIDYILIDLQKEYKKCFIKIIWKNIDIYLS